MGDLRKRFRLKVFDNQLETKFFIDNNINIMLIFLATLNLFKLILSI